LWLSKYKKVREINRRRKDVNLDWKEICYGASCGECPLGILGTGCITYFRWLINNLNSENNDEITD